MEAEGLEEGSKAVVSPVVKPRTNEEDEESLQFGHRGLARQVGPELRRAHAPQTAGRRSSWRPKAGTTSASSPRIEIITMQKSRQFQPDLR